MSDYQDWEDYDGFGLFHSLVGKTIKAIEIAEDKETAKFIDSDGVVYRMYHDQDCCECVSINDIAGDLEDLIDSPLTQAEVVTSSDNLPDVPTPDYSDDSHTWTFYKLATNKGSVTIRWYGSSNGYYSESVRFVRMEK